MINKMYFITEEKEVDFWLQLRGLNEPELTQMACVIFWSVPTMLALVLVVLFAPRTQPGKMESFP